MKHGCHRRLVEYIITLVIYKAENGAGSNKREQSIPTGEDSQGETEIL